MDAVELAMANGYYFDRRIDLEFYDSAGKLLYKLDTPKNGIKPSIMVKGTYIEGSYSISSYISVQNMSYSVDVNSVELIRCKMYYSGMDETLTKYVQQLTGASGITIDFNVLYADQEKEPPNRAVRFQCVVASECKDMFDIPFVYHSSGTIELDNGTPGMPETGSGSKSNAKITMPLLEYLKKLATLRNDYISQNFNGPKKVFKESTLINSIECPSDKASMDISVSPGLYRFGEALRKIGTMEVADESDPKYCKLKVATFRNSIIVTVIEPDDWEERAKKNGCVTDEQKAKFFSDNYSNDRQITIIGAPSLKSLKPIGTKDNPIRLNFVKAAYRSENVVFLSVMYDDRIAPGKFCTLSASAIMGKGSSGSKLFSRITEYGKDIVVRITGAVDFEFSTTDTSWMNFKGPVVEY